jgi:hypothetical protein
MSISAISSSVVALPQAEVAKAPAPVPVQSAPSPADTVSISTAGHQAAGDADRDGDSH